MPRGEGETPSRTIRVPDDLWRQAQKVAKDRDDSVNQAIIRFLKRYVASYPMPEQRDD